MQGKFITLEGGEGVGKSTNLTFIKEYLEGAGKEIIVTREPGGTGIGEEIRNLLLEHRKESMSESVELLLMFASRAQHLQQLILPALKQGKWVLCDRFTDATYAYQGGGRGLKAGSIKILEDFVQKGVKPDCTFLLDAPIEIGLHRASQRGELDRFESEEKRFFQRVREAYLERARAEQERFQVIDASQPLAMVQQAIAMNLKRLLSNEQTEH